MMHEWVDRLASDCMGLVVLPGTTHYFDGKFGIKKVLTTVFLGNHYTVYTYIFDLFLIKCKLTDIFEATG